MRIFHPLTVLTFAAFLASCQKEKSNPPEPVSMAAVVNNSQGEFVNIFKGPEVQVGNGKVRSWIKMTHDDQPIELGLEITPGALENLPDEEMPGMSPHWDIPFHPKVKMVTPFDHLNLNWNPHGHPDPFFGAQHFDFHFYMMTEAERMAIPAWSPSTDVFYNTYPPAGYMPANYSTHPGPIAAVTAMGKHWLPPPPTFLPFTHVMILGSYNGRFNFIEPMITLNYLQNGMSVTKDYSQPLKFQTANNYPTKYNIWKEEVSGNHYVSLSHFVWRNAN